MKKRFVAICALAVFGAFGGASSAFASCYAERVPGTVTYDYVVYFKHDYPKTTRAYCLDSSVNEVGCCGTLKTIRKVNGVDMCCLNNKDSDCYSLAFTDLKQDLTDGTEQCARDLVQKLNGITAGVDTRILLLATTDKTGSHAYNDKLSERRLDLVKQLFGPNLQSKIITHLAGETNDNFTKVTGRNQAERTVRILISNEQQIQQQLETIISSSAEYKNNVSITITKGNADTSAQRIRNIVSNLNGMTRDLGASVWTTKDGNFNTSRLVSDSLAGVVLGTAGGLITSNVIKKNQIKGGFEDIKCTVGGQVVAEFGDDFMVGIQ